MGFFSNIGEALFGTKTKKAGQALTAQAATATTNAGTAARTQANQAGAQAAQYDAAASRSMGRDAADYMQKGQAAAQVGAEQAGQAAATAGTQAALRASRSSGLSKGQAALAAGQQAGDIYSGTYNQNLQTGQDRYQAATGQLAGQGAQMAGRQQGALNTQLGAASGTAALGAGQQAAAAQTASNTWGTIGTIAGGLLSDENSKENIEDVDLEKMLDVDVDAIARKIRPVKYNYKEGEGTPGEKLGVIAQDLEETPLESMVKETSDGTKIIDTNELTGANLNLIIQLARKVSSLEDQLKGAR